MKSRRWSIDDPPALGIDLDCAPGAVAKVEVELLVMTGDPKVDESFRTVKQGLGFQEILGSANRLGAWALTGLAVIRAQQEELEVTRPNGMVLEVSVDPNRSPAALVGIVKQFDPGVERKPNQPVSRVVADGRVSRNRIGEHVLDQFGFVVLLQNPAPALPGRRIRASDCRKREHRLGRDQPVGIIRDLGLKLAQEQQRQLDCDAARRLARGTHLQSTGTSFFHLRRLHLRQSVCRLDSSELPPLPTGIRWSSSRLVALRQRRQRPPSRTNTAMRTLSGTRTRALRSDSHGRSDAI